MSHALERHARYFLDYSLSHPEDWQWFDDAWPQIQRAWEWINNTQRYDLAINYLWGMRVFQNMRGLWNDEILWCKLGLTAARKLGKRKEERS